MNTPLRALSPTTFADAHASREEAHYVIFGVPFDRTTSFRPGARFGPDAIRTHSFNFESYDLETGVDLSEIPVHDAGNTEEFGSSSDMAKAVHEIAKSLWKDAKFPITLGGDHACAAPLVEAIPKTDDVGILYLDAHLDFREEYLGDRRSHACSSRRMMERVGSENIVLLGIRSLSREEREEEERTGLKFFSAYEIHENGVTTVARKALALLKTKNVYLSLDIDSIDPAYAGGTGTPEPFGLSPLEVKEIIDLASDRLVGMDVMEVSPPFDNGNTASLAARLVREVIARTWSTIKSPP